jgi:GT2 family glycosyltransferase
MRCLAALMQDMPARVEVIVVDNGSTQSLDPVRTTWPGLRIVTEARKGAAMARNRGVAETTAPRLFFLDCDCVPDPGWLAAALRVAGRADLVGGRVRVFDETPPPRTGAQAFEAVFAFDNRGYVERKGFSVTANLLTRRDVFEAVGDFTPGLSEDLDWCHRARAMGYRLVYAPDLAVAHPSRGDWVALRKKWLRLTEEGFGVNGAGLKARLLWALKALAMPISIAAHTPRVLRHPGLTPPERRAALVTLARLRLARAGWMLRQAMGLQP